MAEIRDELIGKTLGGCRLLDKLGEGGMGTVYRARHQALNKHVAVKILPASFARDESRVKRFVREARSAAQLEHSNIVQILNIAKQGGLYFIVMQYVKGESLDKKVNREGRLSADEATLIIKETAQALAAAHEKDIIHRDVKPENIMLAASGEVKLMDFGLARIRDMVSELTLPGDVLGTPYYLAPEQARGEAVDGRADIYSLGVTYYYALTGKRPFEGETPVTVIMKHINEPPPDPRQLAPNIPPKVFQVLMKMMHKDVKARYQNMTELMEDLKGLEVTASNDSPQTVIYGSKAENVPAGEAGKKIASRPRWNLIIIGGVTALIIIWMGLFLLKKGDNLREEKPDALPSSELPSVSILAMSAEREAFSKAFKYYSDQPKEYLKNIKTLEALIAEYPDTEWTLRASRIIQSLREEIKSNLRVRCAEFHNYLFAGEREKLSEYFAHDLPAETKGKMVDFYKRVAGVMKLGQAKLELVSIEHIDPLPQRSGQLKASVKVTYKHMDLNKRPVSRNLQHIWIYYENDNWYFLRPKKPSVNEKKPSGQRRR